MIAPAWDGRRHVSMKASILYGVPVYSAMCYVVHSVMYTVLYLICRRHSRTEGSTPLAQP